MNKLLICFLILFSTNTYTKGWGSFWKSHSHYYKEHIEITPEFAENYRVKAGESAQFKGTYCSRDKKESKSKWSFKNYFKRFKDENGCKLIDDSDQFSKHEVRFFFPDTNTDVTDQVILTKSDNSVSYTFNSEAINPELSNRFTIVIKERDFLLRKYLKYQAKVQRHIELISNLKEKHKHKKFLERYLAKLEAILVRLEGKIAKRMEEDPRVYARLDYPVQVENQIAKVSEYTKVVSGFKLSLSSLHGVHFEGEKASILAKVMNLNEKEDDEKGEDKDYSKGDKYKWKYWAKLSLDDEVLASSEKTTLKDFSTIEFNVVSKELSTSDLNRLRLEFFRGKDVPSHAASKNFLSEQSWGEVNYKLDVQADAIAPEWSADSTLAFEYVQDKGHVTLNISDELGRIKLDTFSVELEHTDLAGTVATTNILDKTEIKPLGNQFSDGINIGADQYELVIDLTSLAEGNYKLLTSAADFSGNESQVLENTFTIDKTIPVISINQADNQLTNNPSFSLGYEVVDNSPVTVKLTHNGVEYTTTDQKSGVFEVLLAEGNNTFELSAVDAAGNLAEVVKLEYIKLDTVPPTISLTKPVEGEVVRTLDMLIEGSLDEELSSLTVDGIVVNVADNKFSQTVTRPNEGDQVITMIATDLAGNSSEITRSFTILLNLIRIELVSIEPHIDTGRLCIKGVQGAAMAGLEIEVDGGFFNEKTVIANDKGEFSVELDYSASFEISAEDSELNRLESYTLNYKADTTFSGRIMAMDPAAPDDDSKDFPLPGVKVTIEGSGQSAITGPDGSFSISEPQTGDQKIIVDGTVIPETFKDGKLKFSKLSFNVSLGNLQRNNLERYVYMAPIIKDGTETVVSEDSDTLVTSEFAEGVELEIKVDTAEFPNGTEPVVSMLKIPVEKTSIEVLEFAKPKSVIALEPSGLKFSEPMKLTLPNENGFPEGTEMVIMSKNSETGFWEPDGVASVVGDKIVTLENQGISHFSEVYAAPYGVELKDYAKGSQPGIFNDNGGLKKTVSLPTYKVMGQDIGVNLVYNNLWAKPKAVISNTFNIPETRVRKEIDDEVGNYFTTIKTDGYIESWQKPEYLKSQFISGSIATPWLFFDVSNQPEEGLSTATYGVDLSEMPTGLYPAYATYVLQYRFISVQRIRVRKERRFGGTFTKYYNEKTDELMDAIFPPPLETTIYHQNKINSEIGSGWKLALNQKIVNPKSSKVIIEESDGTLSPYAIDNTVETVLTDSDKITSFIYDKDNKEYTYTSSNKIKTFKDNVLTSSFATTKQNVKMSINHYDKRYKDNSDYRIYSCRYMEYEGTTNVYPSDILTDGSSYYFTDDKSQLYKTINGVQSKIIGKRGGAFYNFADNSYKDISFDYNDGCKELTGFKCGKRTYLKVDDGESKKFNDAVHVCERDSGQWKKTGSNFSKAGSSTNQLNSPYAIVQVGPDHLLVADNRNHVIKEVNVNTGSTRNFIGNKETEDLGAGGYRTQIPVLYPTALTKDKFGNIYFATAKGYIRKVDTEGNVVRIAGLPVSEGGFYGNEGDSLKMQFNGPKGLVVDNDNGYLYVADSDNDRIMRVDLLGTKTITVAGKGRESGGCKANDILDGKAALNVSICDPEEIALDESNNLIYLDSTNKRIRKIIFESSEDGIQRYVPEKIDSNSTLKRLADGSFERVMRDGSMSVFNSNGFHLASIDKVGNTTNFEYTDDLLTKVTDPKGGETVITYLDGLLDSITDPTERITSFIYDNNLLKEVIFPDNSKESFVYNPDTLSIESHFDKNNNEYLYDYNKYHRLTKVTDPEGHSNDIIDGIENTFVPDDNSVDNKKEIAADDPENLDAIMKDANEVETTLSKDETGIVNKITDSKERETFLERDLEGRIKSITHYDGEVTSFIYNEFGDLIEKKDTRADRIETFDYNNAGDLLESTINKIGGAVEDAISQTNSYNSEGLLYVQTDPNGNTITRTYHVDGLVHVVTNSENESVTFSYDADGNLSEKKSHLGETTKYSRDVAGNIIVKENANGEQTLYGYDDFNRLTTVITGTTELNPASGKITTYEYDFNGNLIKIVDPKENITLFEYDGLNRLIKKTTSLGQVTSLAYDGNGNIIEETNPNNVTKIYTYDSDNQLKTKNTQDNFYEMTYDLDGNMTSISDDDSYIEFQYKKIGGDFYVTSSGVSYDANESIDYLLSYDYDEFGNRAVMNTPWGDFDYTYDKGNRLISLTNHKNEFFEFGYDEANRLSEIKRLGGAIKTSYGFDQNSFLTDILHEKSNSDVINLLSYTRDNIGNRKSVTTSRGIASYNYDSESQLKSVLNSEVSGNYASESFNYDDLGNRLNDQLGSFTYDTKSQRLMEDYKHTYTYDNNGNMTGVQEKGMTGTFRNLNYSSENQLIGIDFYENNVLVKQVDYKYDALGRRMAKLVTDTQNSANSFERKYIYDGQEILAELDENDTTLGIYTHSTLRTDDVLAVDVKSTKLANVAGSYFFLKDGNGSIVDIVDSGGNLVQHYAYSSFGKIVHIKDKDGNVVTDNAPVKTSYGFTNREHDSESGMMYFRARFMMPEIGRFIQEDPHPGKLIHPITGINKYIYAGNNPINYTDPSGKSFLSNVLAIGFTIAALYFTGGLIATAASSTVGALGITNGLLGSIVGGAVGSALGGVIGGVAGGIGSQVGGGSWSDGFRIGQIIGSIYGGYKGADAGYTRAKLNGVQGNLASNMNRMQPTASGYGGGGRASGGGGPNFANDTLYTPDNAGNLGGIDGDKFQQTFDPHRGNKILDFNWGNIDPTYTNCLFGPCV